MSRILYPRGPVTANAPLVHTAGVAYAREVVSAGLINTTAGMEYVNFAAFNPASISGLQVWLRADRITGLANAAPVATWPDSSANAFDFTQAVAANQPTYRTNVLNGYPVVRFDGAASPNADFVQISAAGLGIAKAVSGLTVFVVLQNTAGAAAQRYVQISTPTTVVGRFAMLRGASSTRVCQTSVRRLDAVVSSIVNSANNAYTDGVWGIDTGRINYQTQVQEEYLNGTLVASATGVLTAGVTENTDSAVIQIGSQAAGTGGLVGDIAEVLIYNVALSDVNRQSIGRYLGQKYAIAVA